MADSVSTQESYAAFYDLRATGLPGDVDFYRARAREAGGPVLELGCGTGRTLIPIAQDGIEIVGLDISPPMLRIARDKVAGLDEVVQGRITLGEGDMRDFALDQEFALVTIPYRAFLHLTTVEDQISALRRIHEHLRPEGRLAMNMFDPHFGMIVAHTGPLGSAMKRIGEFTHPVTGHRHVVWDTRDYDLDNQLVMQTFMLEELDFEGRVLGKHYMDFTLRYSFRFEMEHRLQLCGFRILALHGDFMGGPFKHGGEQVWIAEKI